MKKPLTLLLLLALFGAAAASAQITTSSGARPNVSQITGLGTGVGTALGVNTLATGGLLKEGSAIGATSAAAVTGTTVTANTSFGFSGTQYLFLDAANIVAQRNTTNGQTLRLYNTFTDASNYERGTIRWSGSIFGIFSDSAGTGSARNMQIGTLGASTVDIVINGSAKWRYDTSGNLTATTDNAIDVGASAATRPRTGYFGTDVRAPRFIATGGTAPTCTTNCGTSPSVSGNDAGFTVTMGGTGSPASGWVITFNGTWPNAPSCHVQMALAGMVVGKMALTAVTTTTTLTVVTNGTAPGNSDKYHVICIGT